MSTFGVGMKGKEIKLINNQEGTHSISARPDFFPVTVKVPLKTDVVKSNLSGYALFVDADDVVYYERDGLVFSTEDGITGTQILTLSTLDPALTRANWFCKTHETGKFILSARKGDNAGGQIWTADTLAGPWTKKLDVAAITGLGNSHFRFSNCWHHYDGTVDLIFVATYGWYDTNNTLPSNHVYMSKDEGVTFTKILELPVVETTVNNHVHSVAYSPWDGWIWVTHGDGKNRGIMYSYDLGKNWVAVSKGDFGKGGWQPTAVVPLLNQVAFGTDNPISNGVLAWYKPDKTEVGVVDYVEQKLNFDGKVMIARRAAQISPNEAYIPMIEIDNTTIYATGDGGFSWHPAITFAKGLPFEIGFTNPDSQGYVWGANMWKFKVSEWTETTKWVKNRFVQ